MQHISSSLTIDVLFNTNLHFHSFQNNSINSLLLLLQYYYLFFFSFRYNHNNSGVRVDYLRLPWNRSRNRRVCCSLFDLRIRGQHLRFRCLWALEWCRLTSRRIYERCSSTVFRQHLAFDLFNSWLTCLLFSFVWGSLNCRQYWSSLCDDSGRNPPASTTVIPWQHSVTWSKDSDCHLPSLLDLLLLLL